MGNYTDVELKISLSKDTPAVVTNSIQCLINSHEIDYNSLPDHNFFKSDRWLDIICNYTGLEDAYVKFDGLSLSFKSSFKNYDSPFQDFLDFIHPYVIAKENELVGSYFYEEQWNEADIIYTQKEFIIKYNPYKDELENSQYY